MAEHNDTGEWGEALARLHLRNNGYDIMHANWKGAKVEIDIVARRDNVLSFVEVKTRNGHAYGTPEVFVDKRKQANMVKAARQYLDIYGHDGDVNFDIIAIEYVSREDYKLEHIKDAFWIYPI